MVKLIPLCCAFTLAIAATSFAADTWPVWRGPTGDGKAPDENPPLKWTEDVNIVWKTPVPGRGHSSPTVLADRVILTTADETGLTQSILAFDRATGKPLWDKVLFTGGYLPRTHARNTQATCTVASDGKSLFAVFGNSDAIHVVALDLAGKELWRRNVGPFASHWGYSTSPVYHEGKVLVAADHRDGGFVTALDAKSGEAVWTQPRPKSPNYTPPVVVKAAGREQIVMAGCDQMTSYDPATGKILWNAPTTTTECVGAAVASGDLVFASGGYPKSITTGVRADGSGEVVWTDNVKVYVPSMLTHEGHLYAVTDGGIVYCWEAATGKQKWAERIGGTFNASPVLAGKNVFLAREDGTTFILRPNPEKLEIIGENKLGDEIFATPSFAGNRIYLRAAGMLYCIGEK